MRNLKNIWKKKLLVWLYSCLNLPVAASLNVTLFVLLYRIFQTAAKASPWRSGSCIRTTIPIHAYIFPEIKGTLSYQRLLCTYSKKYPQLLMQALLTQDQTGQRLRRARHNPRRCICAWETHGERWWKQREERFSVFWHRKCTMMWTVTLEFLQW